jgi:hypothetical protein
MLTKSCKKLQSPRSFPADNLVPKALRPDVRKPSAEAIHASVDHLKKVLSPSPSPEPLRVTDQQWTVSQLPPALVELSSVAARQLPGKQILRACRNDTNNR